MNVLQDAQPASRANGASGFGSLIVTLDLVEEGGDRALPTVSALARLGGVPLELLTVTSPRVPDDVDVYELERRARGTGWSLTGYTILHGEDPPKAIAGHLADRPDSLLVMATSAKPALTGLFLGSVTEEVLSVLDQPVLLVGPRVGPASHTIRPTLVVCVDDSGVAECAVPAIGRWLRTFGGGPPWIVEVTPEESPSRSELGEWAARKFARLLDEQGVRASWDVLSGNDPVHALVEFGRRLCDPIFLAASARWTDGRLHWHSTTRRLVQHSSRPVLVIPVSADDRR